MPLHKNGSQMRDTSGVQQQRPERKVVRPLRGAATAGNGITRTFAPPPRRPRGHSDNRSSPLRQRGGEEARKKPPGRRHEKQQLHDLYRRTTRPKKLASTRNKARTAPLTVAAGSYSSSDDFSRGSEVTDASASTSGSDVGTALNDNEPFLERRHSTGDLRLSVEGDAGLAPTTGGGQPEATATGQPLQYQKRQHHSRREPSFRPHLRKAQHQKHWKSLQTQPSESMEDLTALVRDESLAQFAWEETPWMRVMLRCILGNRVLCQQESVLLATRLVILLPLVGFLALFPWSAFMRGAPVIAVGGGLVGIAFIASYRAMESYIASGSFHTLVETFSPRTRAKILGDVNASWLWTSIAYPVVSLVVAATYAFFYAERDTIFNVLLFAVICLSLFICMCSIGLYGTVAYLHRKQFARMISHVTAGAPPVSLLHEYAGYMDALDLTNFHWSLPLSTYVLANVMLGCGTAFESLRPLGGSREPIYAVYSVFFFAVVGCILVMAARVTSACTEAVHAVHRYYVFRVTDDHSSEGHFEDRLLHYVFRRRPGARLYGLQISNTFILKLVSAVLTSTVVLLEVTSASD